MQYPNTLFCLLFLQFYGFKYYSILLPIRFTRFIVDRLEFYLFVVFIHNENVHFKKKKYYSIFDKQTQSKKLNDNKNQQIFVWKYLPSCYYCSSYVITAKATRESFPTYFGNVYKNVL